MKKFSTDTDELKKIMIDRKIKTTKELSERSGISRNTLANVFNQKAQPTSTTMQKLILCLNIEPKHAGEIFFTRNLRNR